MIGHKVNNYELKRLLGEGGMGAVYLAEHPVLGRRVAVKLLRRELVQEDKLVGRFINEARAADAIRHPNIVQVQDVGLMPDGVPYIVMELLEGQTLGGRIQAAGRLGVGETLALAEQAASAVAAAHAVGIIHRDLKPDNIFLVPDPAFPAGQRVKVLDFGIAKLRIELGGSDLRTKTGAVMGTPAYMSPEQCLGRSAEVDHRTDVYALGVILFEMLCGVPPFVGEGFGEVLVMHMTQPPPTPRAINPDISASVEGVILKALAKRKEDRFATMHEMAQAIAASARDPNISFAATGAAPLRTPTPVRPTTTFSAAAGAVEPISGQASEDELRPPTSRRWGAMVLGAAALGAVGAVLFGLPARHPAPAAKAPAPPTSQAAGLAPALVVEPPVVQAPPSRPTPPAVAENVAPPEAAKVPPADKAEKADKHDKPLRPAKAERDKNDKADKSGAKPGQDGSRSKPAKPAKRERDSLPAATGRQLARPPEPDVLPVNPPAEIPAPPKAQKLEKL